MLCTNSAPPYETPANVAPTQGSQVSAGNDEASFLGYRDARSFRFLGIPFGQKPLGNLRFANAQPYNESYSNTTALAFSPACLQDQDGGLGGTGDGTYSEDCLYLNVYTPELPAGINSTAGLPVAFWIYGGAFTSGSASMPE